MNIVYQDNQHVILHGDSQDRAALSDVLDRFGPQAMWTDPPWNPGIAQSMRSRWGKAEGKADLDVLFDNLWWLTRNVFTSWIEIGQQYTHKLVDRCPEGVDDWDVHVCGLNGLANPHADLIAVNSPPLPDLKELSYVDLMEACISTIPTDTLILDPFLGFGGVVRAANRTGHPTVGIEISEKRANKAAVAAHKRLT